jgi:hypothetical protein
LTAELAWPDLVMASNAVWEGSGAEEAVEVSGEGAESIGLDWWQRWL